MEIKINGIKCDACDYSNDDADWGTTPEEIKATSEAYIAMPCPKCGASFANTRGSRCIDGHAGLAATYHRA